jgi:hypothetical protein
MKKFVLLLMLPVSLLQLKAQTEDPADVNKLNLPGDNFNLAAMLDVFQQSETLEKFEEKINDASLKLNNLDLNNDNKTDYIKVIDDAEGTLHTIVLRAVLGQNDMQDVAVIYVDKKDDKVKVQVIGDETLYGKDYVIEPTVKGADDAISNKGQTPNPGYQANTTINNITNNYYASNNNANYAQPPSYSPPVVQWPVVMFFYGPRYYRWSSPYYWGHYPHYWHSWSPFYYHNYYNHWYCGGAHWNGWWYRPSHHFYHHSHYHNHYYGHRKASQTVTVNVRNNNYQNTYVVQKNYKAGKSNFPSANPRPGTRPGNTLINTNPNFNSNPRTNNKPNNNLVPNNPGSRPGSDFVKPNTPNKRPTSPSRSDMKDNKPRPRYNETPVTQPAKNNIRPSAPNTRPSTPNRPNGSNQRQQR